MKQALISKMWNEIQKLNSGIRQVRGVRENAEYLAKYLEVIPKLPQMMQAKQGRYDNRAPTSL